MINFNTDPYRDDFDPTKHFHRILFRPGRAVQARELTQSQTILQDQITKFAANLFTQNTPITGGQLTINKDVYYIKLLQTYNNISLKVDEFLNSIITDDTGTVVAKVLAVADATIVNNVLADPPTFIISYISGHKFEDNSVIYKLNSNSVAGLIAQNASGRSSTAHISDGVFYVVNGYTYSEIANPDGTYTKYSIGNFVGVDSQTAILDKYDNTPSLRVGLNVNENIYDYVDDVSLLDPAIGASNYQAPGADRYVIKLTLETRQLSSGDDQNFIELMRIENGIITKQLDSTVYATIDDYFAKRTYDTNGDYIVNNFKLTPSTDSSNSSQYIIGVGKGLAYVRGYRSENQSTINLTGDKSRDYNTILNNSVSLDYGNYLYVNNLTSSNTANFDFTTFQPIDLHLAGLSSISQYNTNQYNSTLVATAKVRGIEFDHYTGSSSNTKSYVFKAYVCDVNTKVLSSNAKGSSTNTITFFDNSLIFSNTSGVYNGVILSIDNGPSAGDVRKIISYDGSTKTATVDTNFSTTVANNSTFSLRFGIKDIETLTIANAQSKIVSSAAIDQSGKVGGLITGDTILNDTAYPELLFKIGNPYVKSLVDSSYTSKMIFRKKTFNFNSGHAQLQIAFDTPTSDILNFNGRTGTPLTSAEILSYYTVIVRSPGSVAGINAGDILDFTNYPNRTVTVSNDKNSVTFDAYDLTVSPSSPLIVDVFARVEVTNADNSNHILKSKNLITTNMSVASSNNGVLVNGNTFVDLVNAQVYIQKGGFVSSGSKQSLYVADIKRINKIIDTGSPAIKPQVSMFSIGSYDVTSNFAFNNGQTDNYYDHGYLTLKPGAPTPRGNLLVLFDYYSHSGGDGYFSIKSYQSPISTNPENYPEIGNYTAKNGSSYSLKDSLDFRPSRINATSVFKFQYTSDPSISDSGNYIPLNLTDFYSDYDFYLARKDLLVLTKDRNFEIIRGIPSTTPTFPIQPDGSLLIGKMSLDPYTAFMPGESLVPNFSIETVQHKRWTMQDISNLQTRINNIEYYTALSALEQKAQSLQVPDVNGINRFKNGILVDDFSSFSTADTSNRDFLSCINKRTRQMTASQKVTNLPLQSIAILNSLGNISDSATKNFGYVVRNINKTTNLFTLPYSTANVITQKLASNTVNLNPFNAPVYQGVLDINPPMDNWVDNTRQPDLLIVDPSMQVLKQSNTVNVLSTGDWKTVPGTTQTSITSSSSTQYIINHNWSQNWGFGLGVGESQTITSTQTQTYGTLSQTNTLGYYTNIGNTYSLNNNYITDISILPYIRSQQLLIRAAGLKINTKLSCWFDGTNVNQYITNPDTIELSGKVGNFTTGDVLGYFLNTTYYPIATVAGVYNYPNTANVRLYVTSNYHTAFNSDIPYSTLQNAQFSANGAYLGSTAKANITSSKIVSVHKTGLVGKVGGNFTDVIGTTTLNYYNVWVSGYGSFATAYGIWGNAQSTGNLPTGKFNFTAPKAGTYYMRVVVDESCSGYIKINGTTVWTNGTGGIQDYTLSLVSGTNTIEFTATGDEQGDSLFAVAISSSTWSSQTTTNGPIIFNTRNIKGVTAPLNAGTQIELPGGGLYYVGATQISLNGIANTSNGFYANSSITFNSIYISSDGNGVATTYPQTFTANILTYDGTTSTVTLDTPVNISVGINLITVSDITSQYTINGTMTSYQLAVQRGGLSSLSSDESGQFVGVFNIPPSTFKTGDRIFRVDDRVTISDPSSSDTYAEGTFTASGLSTKSQALDFGPSVSGARNTFTQTNYKYNQLLSSTTTTAVSYSPWDPVAQSFLVDSTSFPNGLYLDSISVFFRTKPQTLNTPVTLSIVGTLNGYPNGQTLDYSIVTLNADQIKVSETPHYLDSNTKTNFKFAAPVYIQPGTLYAFILKSASSEYTAWVAGQDANAVPSTTKINPTDPNPSANNVTKIGTVPSFGGLFESQNGMTWVANPTKSMMVVINRCVFDTTANPQIPFVIPAKLPTRKPTSDDLRYFIDANTSGNLLNTTTVGDLLSDAYNITTTDFIPSMTNIYYTYNSVLNSSRNYSGEIPVDPGKLGCPTYDDIYLSDGLGERILLSSSNNSFILNAYMASNSDAVSPIISDDGLSLYNIQWSINNLGLTNNQIIITNSGEGYDSNSSNTFAAVSAPDIGSDNAEVSVSVANGEIIQLTVTHSGSGYLNSPTITITDAANTSTSSANVNVVSEFYPHGGNALCRYFTKKVVLAEGNDSQDLRVYYTAYKPTGTNIYVFYKLLNSNDPSNFDDNGWQLMTDIGSNKNVYSKTRSDLYEFECAPGTNNVADNSISYVGSNGQQYTSFIQFAIKVVMTTNDNTTVPFLTDIRALALPSGTGL